MDWKKLGNKLLYPPAWLLAALTLASAVLLAVVFAGGREETPLAYASYVLAFYTLCVACIFCVTALPGKLSRLRAKLAATPLASRYAADPAFRVRSTMYLPLYINLAYIAIHLFSWYRNRSWWFAVLAGYYLILALMWALLAGYVRGNDLGTSLLGEWKRARSCACLLLVVNLSLSGAVLMILFRHKGYDYPGLLIYVMAMYTFYSTIHAVVDIVKYRAFESPVMSTAKIVSLCAALVSMLNLETAMFAQFGAELAEQSQRIFIILTGAGVSISVVTLSLILIVRATKEIRREKYGK